MKKWDAAAPRRAAARGLGGDSDKSGRAAPLAQKCPRPAVDFPKMRGRGRISAVRAATAAELLHDGYGADPRSGSVRSKKSFTPYLAS